jgi:hypothetical protein
MLVAAGAVGGTVGGAHLRSVPSRSWGRSR